MAWVPIPDLGQGLNLDGSAEELSPGVSTAGSNVRYRAGYAERFKGMETAFTTPLITPYHNVCYTVGTSNYMVYAGLQKTYVDDGTTQTDITNADNTGSIDDRWCGFVFNGVYIQNNGIDVPQYWGGNTASNLANLTAWPAGYTAGWMRSFGSYLVAGDITRAGVRERGTLLWSHEADPGTIPTSWDIADATKDAGDFPLAETNGTLLDSLPMGGMNVIYKDDAIHFQQSVQSSLIFRFGRLPGETGLLARGCVVNTPVGHVFLTSGLDVVVHTGQGLRSILEGRMRTWLAANMNQQYARRCFLVAHWATNEVLICFPADSAVVCTKAIVWNWKDNTFAVRTLPNVTYGTSGKISITGATDAWSAATGTWATDSAAWGEYAGLNGAERVVFATSTPSLAIFDSTQQDAGSSFTATMECTGLHFDSPETVKLCRGVRPKIDAAAGTVVYVQIGASMTPDVSPTWQAAQTFAVGTSIETYGFASGRFLAVRFYTTADDAWRIRSCQLDVVPQGRY